MPRAAAEAAFSRLLRNPKFAARIAELSEQAAEGAVMSARQVLEELSKIGRANMADFIRAFACGDPVEAVRQLTPNQAAALCEVTVEQFMDGGGEDAREIRKVKFKLIAKTPALDLLGKHHGIYAPEKHEHTLGGVAERLAAALARAEGRADANMRRDTDRSRRR